ncbi:MBL fold metallo-hydrolase [Ciceribacter selenitireducens]|uniref:Metallo-beta-lactamase domain-containing protein n=2 Tax=Ciceribacter selenitireducens ATCC BAA-1503 TaxID=1336235 RepID=A0A380TKX4_9HYPH|nr:MBL fold metallo-hydrolase [Ciceribacter selenitireducens]SUS16616.1 unnamed protein product [Ciceribacter selenitireducens ATCC BAA-1503]
MKLKFLGTGDAFGSGGRHNACFLLDVADRKFMIECGATAMVSLRQHDVQPNSVETIVISHGHGDHFGGLPFFLLDAQLVSRRTDSLVIVGPPGIEDRLWQLMESMFPGSSKTKFRFPLHLVEMQIGGMIALDDAITLEAREVSHPSGTATLALRLVAEGKVIGYTADTEWVDALEDIARDADLLISECYHAEPKGKFHLDHQTLCSKLPALNPKRVILTHLSAGALEASGSFDYEVAHEGLEISL